MKVLLVALLSTVFLTGCIDEDEEYAKAKAVTEESFAAPETVGTLPDGREVKMVVHGIPYNHDRFVYFVDDGGVSTNQVLTRGKTSSNSVVFAPPEPPITTAEYNEKVYAAAQKLSLAHKLEQEAKALLVK